MKIWANSPTEKTVRGLVGISQATIKKWVESGNSAQIGRIATAIRKAYNATLEPTPVTEPESGEVIFE